MHRPHTVHFQRRLVLWSEVRESGELLMSPSWVPLAIDAYNMPVCGSATPSRALAATTQAFVIDFQSLSRSAINSARCRSSRPSRMLMSFGSARK
jgi:hypothetical protein